MKIGILTFHSADNYGAVLQCYALQEHLKKEYPQCEICVIDYRNSFIEKSYKLLCKRKTLLSTLTQFIYLPRNIKKRIAFSSFRKQCLNLGEADFSKYDVIYYGSDQIWNTTLTGGDLVYFGKGFEGKKIAFGASDGGELQLSNEIKLLLNSFSEITCREQSLADKLIEQGVTVPVSTVLDPVFLLTKEEWKKIAILPKKSGYILAYKISQRDDFDMQAERLGNAMHKKIIQIVYMKPLRKIIYNKQKFIECIGPDKFIGYIFNSDYIITTSFHGTAFSIIANKDFCVLKFNNRIERITNLLHHFNYEKKFVDDVSEEIKEFKN